ncbi:MAG: acyltransferase [Legionella sp.]|nr:acyltransferase [Legionella sp.]
MSKVNKSGGQLQGVFAILVLVASTTFFFIPVLFIGLLKLFPHFQWRVYCTRLIDNIIAFWCDTNNAYINRTQRIRWNVQGVDSLNPKAWHLLVANHQSWLDIVILQRLFNRKIPMLKFFIKDQLKWVPLLGFAWWAMGSPFMKRYSKDYLLKNPHKKGQDLEATRKALEIFKHTPSTIMNFVEGTRFTSAKKELQQSPYLHLLKPKSGGISFVISAMSEHIQNFLDVTIIYPDNHSLWDFLCHRIKAITVHVREIPIPGKFRNNQLIENEEIKLEFRDWLNEQWAEKDALIKSLQ